MTPQTFVEILTSIQTTGLTNLANSVLVYITRQAYLTVIINSNGLVSYVNLPYFVINLTDFTVSQSNYPPDFQFTVNDLTTANDWVTFTYPY